MPRRALSGALTQMARPRTRIKGLVRAMRYVQERIAVGVTRDEAPRLERYASDVIAAVESIFQQHRITARTLPRPSREAYAYIRGVVKNGVRAVGRKAPRDGTLPAVVPSRVRVGGAVRARSEILNEISVALESNDPESVAREAAPRLTAEVDRIEAACVRSGGTPADLPMPSRRAYSVLAFLAGGEKLDRYVGAVASVRQLIVGLTDAHAAARSVRLDEIGGIYRYRSSGANCFFRASPGFIAADDEALQLVVRDAFLDQDEGVRKALHEFCQSDGFVEIVQEIDGIAAPALATRGAVHDLAEICERVRTTYFDPGIAPPAGLSWSDSRTFRTFGHYSSLRDRVTISRSLDDRRVPRYAIDFVMYHELLHKAHGIGFATSRSEAGRGRRTMHTRAFRIDERRFPRYVDARTFLDEWSATIRRSARR